VRKLVSTIAFEWVNLHVRYNTDAAASQMSIADMVGTYPKRHARMLAKVLKMPPKYPKCHRHNLACPCDMAEGIKKKIYECGGAVYRL
jgi:hypothetical protein